MKYFIRHQLRKGSCCEGFSFSGGKKGRKRVTTRATSTSLLCGKEGGGKKRGRRRSMLDGLV